METSQNGRPRSGGHRILMFGTTGAAGILALFVLFSGSLRLAQFRDVSL